MFTFFTTHTPTSQANATRGFSLVEVLVAISILLIALTGPMTSIRSSSQSTTVANQQVVATFLAQEGIELIKKVRDDNQLQWFANPSHQAWTETLSDLDTCLALEYGCNPYITGAVDTGTVNLVDCQTTSDCRLYYNASSDRARYLPDDSYAETPYTRVVELTPGATADEYIVEVVVSWRSSVLREQQSVRLETAIFNTYESP